MGQRHLCVCAEGAYSLPQLVSRQLQKGIKGCWQQLLGQQAPPLPLLLLLPDLQGTADILVRVNNVTLAASVCSPTNSCAPHVKRRAEVLGKGLARCLHVAKHLGSSLRSVVSVRY